MQIYHSYILQFGGKKNNFDDFIEAEMKKITKNNAPDSDQNQFYDEEGEIVHLAVGDFGSDMKSNFENSPNPGGNMQVVSGKKAT